jgi:DNA-binding IclR family transcriptional regulator
VETAHFCEEPIVLEDPEDKSTYSLRQGGTQLLERVIAILNHLATTGEKGDRLTGIASAVDLNLSTAHRIVAALEHHGLVDREEATRSHRLGLALFALGAQAADGTGLRRLCRPALTRLSAETGETSYLMVRSGLNAVCVDRHPGSYVIESLTQNVGGTLPLGIGSGSLAVLSSLTPLEIGILIKANKGHYRRYGLMPKDVEKAVASGMRAGYVVTHDVLIEGVSGIAMPIRPAGRDVVAALTLNLTTARLANQRQERIVALLRAEIAAIETQLTKLPRSEKAKEGVVRDPKRR